MILFKKKKKKEKLKFKIEKKKGLKLLGWFELERRKLKYN
jgi:hypothetical protein